MFLSLTVAVLNLIFFLSPTFSEELPHWLNNDPAIDYNDDLTPIVCHQLEHFSCCSGFVMPNLYVCSHGAVCDAKTGQKINVRRATLLEILLKTIFSQPEENHLIHLNDLNRLQRAGKFKTAARPSFIGKLLQENLPMMIEDFLSKYYESLPKAKPQPMMTNGPQFPQQQHQKQEEPVVLRQPLPAPAPLPSDQHIHGTWYLPPPVPPPQQYQYVLAPTYSKPMQPYRQTIVVYGGDQPRRRKYYISSNSPRLSQNRPYFGVTFIG